MNRLVKPREGQRERRTTEITERASNITRLVRPESDGGSPGVRVRIAILDVLGDLAPLEPPDCNVCVIPKHGVDTTSSHIEGGTSASCNIGEGTTSVVTGRALALSRERSSEETLGHRAVRALVLGSDIGVHIANRPVTGMESVLVEIVGVDVFEDIDLKGSVGIRMPGRNEKGINSYLPTIWPTRAIS